MSDDSNPTTNPPAQSIDPVRQLLQGNNSDGQALTAEQRNERREALLKRQKEAREKAQQVSQAARANAANNNAGVSTIPSTTAAPAPAAPAPIATSTATPVAAAAATATAAPVSDAPVRENMVQQAVSFLSSPSVQSAEESKKTQFLEKKGLTAKEIELAKARVIGTASAPAVSTTPPPQQQLQQPYQPSTAPVSSNSVPPPVPPRNYAPMQAYAQPMYIPQQQQAVVDPNAFKKKLVIAMLISGGVTVLTSILVQKVIYPMVRGITSARQKLAVSQTELLSKLKERLSGYREYLQGLHLGSNRVPVKKIKDTKTTVEEEEDETGSITNKTLTVSTETSIATKPLTTNPSTVKQLDGFSKKLETHANSMNFEQLKATRATTQDLAEYITKETYALTSSIAYPTSRYYGYNTAGAAASGKGGLTDPTTPESALKSEIRSLKGLLLNWRNFPAAKESGVPATGVAGANGFGALPNLVQQ
ncbi:peroxisomal membrane anchor protein conserved region-domain-containing protein [Gamsiella multidivaricata]|uniref:peroxisomal membrane anchor protein conserved region-domain-containing protein n=1 Tax=Gamsiella multidivaricata TaxID=101098 RepID=UPI002220FC6F|nr:peroxisomal membrane anchor protein conserved region-domain-containing protein [Gamsiella multidivaricata]KAI7821715.1 peroxisomal membrane anchor protein conserved region-domain-containing protein [Gamsiella multidivaricata]